MKNKTVLIIVLALAAASVVYMCWSRKKEWLSDLGYGTGMLNQGIGPTYEGFAFNEKDENKEGFCGACS
jgi:hypothetical protein